MICLLSITLFLFIQVSSHPFYRDRIPNGYGVPNPCPQLSAVWNPVGHYNPLKFTVLLNPFDADFTKANFTWTRELCMKDSDRDGKTNGKELGDPQCVWTMGATPHEYASSHPGICEPVGSTRCHYQHFSCGCLEKCQGLVGERVHLK